MSLGRLWVVADAVATHHGTIGQPDLWNMYLLGTRGTNSQQEPRIDRQGFGTHSYAEGQVGPKNAHKRSG